MKTALLVPLLALMLAGTGGCGMVGGRQDSPVKMREKLEVPPDLARPQSGDTAVRTPGEPAAYSALATRPAESEAATGSDSPQPVKGAVRLERDGALRWLVVEDSAERIVPRVRSVLAGRQLELTVDNPRAGIFETEWKEKKVVLGKNILSRALASLSSTGLRDKYRIRIEPGRVSGTSEVYVSHQGLEEVVIDSISNINKTAWQPRASDPEAEAQLLSELMASIGQINQTAGTEAATVAASSARATPGGLLLPNQDLERAWRRVGQVLDRSAFVIEDRDRSQGTFYIYDREAAAAGKKRDSFGGLIKFGSSDTESVEERLQIVMTSAGDDTLVRVLNVKGEKTGSRNGQRLFDYLQQQLQ